MNSRSTRILMSALLPALLAGHAGAAPPATTQPVGDAHRDVESGIESASMTADVTEVYGDQAFQWGTYAQRVVVPGKPAADYNGRFVAQWSRLGDGRWLIRRLLTQPSPGAP